MNKLELVMMHNELWELPTHVTVTRLMEQCRNDEDIERLTPSHSVKVAHEKASPRIVEFLKKSPAKFTFGVEPDGDVFNFWSAREAVKFKLAFG